MLLLNFAIVAMAFANQPVFDHDLAMSAFLRGNTHTHTNWSDGDSKPDVVIKRYKDLGYNFVVITDHNRADTATHFQGMNDEHFMAMTGEEVTYEAKRENKNVPVHVNAICGESREGHPLPVKWVGNVETTLKTAVDFARNKDGGIAQINHPNYGYALSLKDIEAIDGTILMEIANQHQAANNAGDHQHEAVEKLWDEALTAGKTIYGVASDDMHALNQGHGDKWAFPGRGWIQVAADSLTPAAIRDALAAGKFYSSTGVTLSSVKVDGGTMALQIPTPKNPREVYTTEFIGKNGQVLSKQTGLSPSYTLKGDEGYVRAKVYGPNHKMAWVQPVRVRNPAETTQ